MLTIYGSYIRFQFSLVSALTYFHEIDLKWPPGNIPLSENPSPPHTHTQNPSRFWKWPPSKMVGLSSELINDQPLSCLGN